MWHPTLGSMTSLSSFVSEHSEQNRNQGFFELESEWLLEVNLRSAMVLMKIGSMVAYRGDITFAREGILEQGVGNVLKKVISGEGAVFTKATGTGKLYLANRARLLTIIKLAGEALFMNGNDLLAVEPTLTRDIRMVRRLTGMLSGGLFNVKLEGTGAVVIATHGKPMVLEVTPQSPVCTDPQATVGWSSGLEPELKTDIQLKSLFGRGSGESLQMRFEGKGFVIVQPYEERLARVGA